MNHLNQMLRGHYAYYGVAGKLRALLRVHRAVQHYWRKMLSSRASTVRYVGSNFSGSRNGSRCLDPSCTTPIESCRLSPCCESTSEEPSAGNLHAGFCGSRGRVTASATQRRSAMVVPTATRVGYQALLTLSAIGAALSIAHCSELRSAPRPSTLRRSPDFHDGYVRAFHSVRLIWLRPFV